MKPEDKQLLLKDLCARLPYGIIVRVDNGGSYKTRDLRVRGITESNKLLGLTSVICWIDELVKFKIEEVKPYLRPLSSMTKEESNEFKQIFEIELKALESPAGHTIESAASSAFAIDFYNKYHFDYRGLISKGLALEAPKDMYKIKHK